MAGPVPGGMAKQFPSSTDDGESTRQLRRLQIAPPPQSAHGRRSADAFRRERSGRVCSNDDMQSGGRAEDAIDERQAKRRGVGAFERGMASGRLSMGV